MKKKLIFVVPLFVILASLLLGSMVYGENVSHISRTVAPVVSTDWLEANSGRKNLVIIDVRAASDYLYGHIANSINVPFEVPVSPWISMRGDLILEAPEETVLFNTIGSCGITKDSTVVIVTSVATPPYPLANATRVADTLIYAGLRNVAILDGGYTKWVSENRATTMEVPNVNPVAYQGKINKDMFVSVDYVERHLGKSILIDARDADVYFGVTVEVYANKAGHIPTARSLPTPWIWNADGTYKAASVLKEMASGVIDGKSLPAPRICYHDGTYAQLDALKEMFYGVGKNQDKEIIIYCGVGGYASSWWFVLTQILGYENVKIFDGAAQEWVKYNDMVKYTWAF